MNVEAVVVGVAGHFVDLETLYKQNAGADVRLLVSGKPDFVVEKGLFENEAGSLLQIGQKAAAEANVLYEVGFEAGDVVSLFVDPNHAG